MPSNRLNLQVPLITGGHVGTSQSQHGKRNLQGSKIPKDSGDGCIQAVPKPSGGLLVLNFALSPSPSPTI